MGSILVSAQGEGGVAIAKDKPSGVWPRLKAGLFRLGPSNHHQQRSQQPQSAEAQPLKVIIDPDLNGVLYKDIGTNYVPTPYYSSPWPYKGITIAALLTALSLTLTTIMWLTNIYGNAILKLVSIRNDIDMVFEMWRVPPSKPTLSVYIFNYTNHKKVLEGKEKPRVIEVGPYVFNEKMERINVKFNSNGTVSFQENRTIVANVEKSNGAFDDTVIVPNVPVITILKAVNSLFYLEHTLYSKIIDSVNVQLFQKLSVNDFIWGHEDAFFKLLKSIDGNAKGFGFLAKRRGVHHDVVTMNTGELDIESVGQITRWNGQDKIGCWGDTDCDEITGSDGTIFPAKATKQGKTLYIYNHAMCRRIALHFNKTTMSKDGLPVQEYNVARNLFDFTNNNTDNKCYQYKGSYPQTGVFNTGPCQNDKPIYVSFPHFWLGDKQLQESIIGVNADENKHKSYFQIHKKLGVSLKAVTRFQLNIMLHKAKFVSQTSKLQNESIILPIAWLDYDSGEFPEHFINVMHHLTYTVTYVEEALKWLFLTCTLTAVAFFIVQIRTFNLRKI